ncbi:MAG: carbohydrate kinase family protein [Christensenellales bacterium]
MKEPYVVCIGKNAIDEYYTMDAYPALGEKAIIEYTGTIPGGFIANAAAVAGALGAVCYMIDVLGTDQYTEVLLDAMKQHNVKTDYIEIEEGAANYKTMILMLGVEKTIFLIKTKKRGPTIGEGTRALLCGARFVYSNIIDLRRLPDPYKIIEEFTSCGADLFIDAETSTFQSREEDRFFFEHARIISLNEFALEKYSRGKGEQALRELLEADPEKIILITLGNKGCRILSSSGEVALPAYPVKPVDTTGAGDTFNGAFMYGLLNGYDIIQAARFATAAAARCVLLKGPRSGAVPGREVCRFMENGGQL